jgi:hypothetical protein
MNKEYYDIEKYKTKTGRNPELLITNVSPEYLYIYESVVPKFKEIEILDIAYDVFGNILPDRKVVVFKEKFDMDLLQVFWKECNLIRH